MTGVESECRESQNSEEKNEQKSQNGAEEETKTPKPEEEKVDEAKLEHDVIKQIEYYFENIDQLEVSKVMIELSQASQSVEKAQSPPKPEPPKRINKKYAQIPWISPELSDAMLKRDSLKTRHKMKPNDTLWQEYKNARNICNRMSRDAKARFVSQGFKNTANDKKSQPETPLVGDINLPRDKFLQEQLKLDDGWVPLEVLTRFHRLAKLTPDVDKLGAAIAKSTSGLLELSEDGKKVRRNPELPLPELNEERRKELLDRTLYVKGFPADAKVDLVLNFFEDYPVVENILMRRYMERPSRKWLFKGSVFATFKTKEQAEKFLNTEGIKYGDTVLIKRWQEEYTKEKKEAYQSFKDKKLKEQKEKQEEKVGELKLAHGAVLKFEGVGEGVTREEIKEAIQNLEAEVAFIDFKKGDADGWVRLQDEGGAQRLYDKLTDGKLTVKTSEVTFRVLEGEEEETFLAKTAKDMLNRRKFLNKNRYARGGKNNRGGGGGRKRKQGAHNDAPAQKIQAQ